MVCCAALDTKLDDNRRETYNLFYLWYLETKIQIHKKDELGVTRIHTTLNGSLARALKSLKTSSRFSQRLFVYTFRSRKAESAVAAPSPQ